MNLLTKKYIPQKDIDLYGKKSCWVYNQKFHDSEFSQVIPNPIKELTITIPKKRTEHFQKID